MTKVDIISGFLGAGKTTLIAKLLKEGLAGEQVVLIENEFGEIGIDGGFLKESGVEIREMNSGRSYLLRSSYQFYQVQQPFRLSYIHNHGRQYLQQLLLHQSYVHRISHLLHH